VRPSAFIGVSLLVALATQLPGETAVADDKPKPANPLTAKPANPLLEDPFVGEYAGAGMVLILKPAAGGEGYEGEIRKRGQTFTLTAAMKGDDLAGSFTFDEFTYDFTCKLEDQALKFTTEGRTVSLKRREAPDAAPPVTPAPRQPAPSPVDPPARDHPAPPLVTPVPSKVTAAPPPQRLDYASLSAQQLRQACWTRFPAGTSATFEDATTLPGFLPQSLRYKVIYQGIGNGKVMLRHLEEDGNRWTLSNSPAAAPTDEAIRIEDLGFTRGESAAEDLSINGSTIRCDRMSYTGQVESDGASMAVRVLLWRSKEVDVPTLVLDLPRKRLLLEPDMAKVQALIEYRDVKVQMLMQLDALNVQGRVGRHAVQYAVMTGRSTIESRTARIERASEYWISHQVPGGIIKTVETEKRNQSVRQRVIMMVDFAAAADQSDKSPEKPIGKP
jgi:hypothetical protein